MTARWRALAVALLCAALAACTVAPPGPNSSVEGEAVLARAPDEMAVHFLSVGQGDATLFVAPDATLLIDSGRHDRDDLVGLLRERVEGGIDVLAVTHAHADHIGQFDRVMEAFDVAEVWWSGTPHTTRTFERALDALESNPAAYAEPRAGDRTEVGSLRVEILHPDVLTGDVDADSLVLRVTHGEVSFLFTGDAPAQTEARLIERYGADLAATVYQVGHHGSSTSTTPAFLDAVDPDVAVYSAGVDNPYGHPHDEVVHTLRDAAVTVYGTPAHGHVTVTTDGQDYEIRTQEPAS